MIAEQLRDDPPGSQHEGGGAVALLQLGFAAGAVMRMLAGGAENGAAAAGGREGCRDQGGGPRALTAAEIAEAPQVVVCDVSFIGLAKALPAALALAAPGADLVALVKPQFEVGPERVGKGGLVKDAGARAEALAAVEQFLEASGWTVLETADSPVEGGDGNREHLLWARKESRA